MRRHGLCMRRRGLCACQSKRVRGLCVWGSSAAVHFLFIIIIHRDYSKDTFVSLQYFSYDRYFFHFLHYFSSVLELSFVRFSSVCLKQ